MMDCKYMGALHLLIKYIRILKCEGMGSHTFCRGRYNNIRIGRQNVTTVGYVDFHFFPGYCLFMEDKLERMRK